MLQSEIDAAYEALENAVSGLKKVDTDNKKDDDKKGNDNYLHNPTLNKREIFSFWNRNWKRYDWHNDVYAHSCVCRKCIYYTAGVYLLSGTVQSAYWRTVKIKS